MLSCRLVTTITAERRADQLNHKKVFLCGRTIPLNSCSALSTLKEQVNKGKVSTDWRRREAYVGLWVKQQWNIFLKPVQRQQGLTIISQHNINLCTSESLCISLCTAVIAVCVSTEMSGGTAKRMGKKVTVGYIIVWTQQGNLFWPALHYFYDYYYFLTAAVSKMLKFESWNLNLRPL